jgi:bacterioferritin (cytochrome b1)
MEGSSNNIARKIDLHSFIQTLIKVYNSGADYIDLIGKSEETSDTVSIVVHEDYLSDEEEDIDDDGDDAINDSPLSDENINDLI